MPNKIVLIPFAEADSFENLISTRGGNMVPETEKAKVILEEEYKKKLDVLRKINVHRRLEIPANAHPLTLISALKDESDPKAREIGAELEKARNDYIRAKKQRDQAITEGWKNIEFGNVVCADSNNLVPALRKLQAKDDKLFIRGHCGEGKAILMSCNGCATIAVDELIKILQGKLNKKFPGKIIIYGCKSAKDTVVSESFASGFANEMVEQGWINCRFFGYNEKVMELVDRDTGQRVTTAGNRAKMARVEVTPDILPYLAHTRIPGELPGSCAVM
jgi:hypothetical protein